MRRESLLFLHPQCISLWHKALPNQSTVIPLSPLQIRMGGSPQAANASLLNISLPPLNSHIALQKIYTPAPKHIFRVCNLP